YAVRATGNAQLYETSLVALPAAVRLGAAWLAQEVRLWQAGARERLEGRMLTVHLGQDGPRTTWHELTRRPQCRAGGHPALASRTGPVALRRHRVVAGCDGGYRVEPAEATLGRLARHISPLTGVVTWLAPVSRDPDGLVHSFAAGHNFAMGPDTP